MEYGGGKDDDDGSTGWSVLEMKATVLKPLKGGGSTASTSQATPSSSGSPPLPLDTSGSASDSLRKGPVFRQFLGKNF